MLEFLAEHVPSRRWSRTASSIGRPPRRRSPTPSSAARPSSTSRGCPSVARPAKSSRSAIRRHERFRLVPFASGARARRAARARAPSEGGYRETWRSPVEWPRTLPAGYPGPRAAASILSLLPSGVCSALHRVRSEELWLHHQGDAVELGIGATRAAATAASGRRLDRRRKPRSRRSCPPATGRLRRRSKGVWATPSSDASSRRASTSTTSRWPRAERRLPGASR